MDRYNRYNREIPTDCRVVEHDGQAFIVGITFDTMRLRYDPLTIAIAATAIGTGVQIAGTLKQGKDAEKLSKQRAAIDIKNAEATRKASVEKARIKADQGHRLRETQKSSAAASGIRINAGSPLVIEAHTRDIISKDVGYILEAGRVESDAFRSSAAIEIAQGKAIKKQSRFRALSQGIMGIGSIAFMGSQLGGAPSGGALPIGTGTARPQGFLQSSPSGSNFPTSAFG